MWVMDSSMSILMKFLLMGHDWLALVLVSNAVKCGFVNGMLLQFYWLNIMLIVVLVVKFGVNHLMRLSKVSCNRHVMLGSSDNVVLGSDWGMGYLMVSFNGMMRVSMQMQSFTMEFFAINMWNIVSCVMIRGSLCVVSFVFVCLSPMMSWSVVGIGHV